jgi:hypothetical protein
VLGYDANKTLVGIADSLAESAWKTLSRQKPQAKKRRAKSPNYKERIVVANGYENQILQGESYTEFDYQPVACSRSYRMVVVRVILRLKRYQLFAPQTVPVGESEPSLAQVVLFDLSFFGR